MNKCCGQTLSSRFCPNCGVPSDNTPVFQILRHLSLVAASKQKTLETYRRHYADRPNTIAAIEEIAKKWALWRDTMRELIDKHATADVSGETSSERD